MGSANSYQTSVGNNSGGDSDGNEQRENEYSQLEYQQLMQYKSVTKSNLEKQDSQSLMEDWSEDHVVPSYGNMSINNNTEFELDYQDEIDSNSIYDNQSLYNFQLTPYEQKESFAIENNGTSFSQLNSTYTFVN